MVHSRTSLLRAPASGGRMAAALLAAVVAVALMFVLAVAGATPASAVPADGAILAVDGDLLGPDPMPRVAEDNPARELGGYEDREVPFTWGAAWLLSFTGLAGLAVMALVYFRAVDRPGRSATTRR